MEQGSFEQALLALIRRVPEEKSCSSLWGDIWNAMGRTGRGRIALSDTGKYTG